MNIEGKFRKYKGMFKMITRSKANQNINKINEVENSLSDMLSGGG